MSTAAQTTGIREELKERIELNYRRLCEPYYQIPEIFSAPDYGWQGDREGRALMAFAAHYRMTGRKNPCMDALIEALPGHTNRLGYFGTEEIDPIDEQQLSGHNWYLNGLLDHAELSGDPRAMEYARAVVENLYLRTAGRYGTYPVVRPDLGLGDVSGSVTMNADGWLLSSDVGCAFMSVDGLARYYVLTKDARVLELLREMHGVFCRIDKLKIQAQTHCTLTAARGFLLLYKETGDDAFLQTVLSVLELYERSGMTYTYQNYNWWGKGDTWTEPCAIVDSLILYGDLYRLTGNERYRKTAVRIWHNGFSSAQNHDGGAGSMTTVGPTNSVLSLRSYENPFCCTMRLACGLEYAQKNADLLQAENGPLIKAPNGVYMAGDLVYAEVTVGAEYEPFVDRSREICADGRRLIPLVKTYRIPKEGMKDFRERIVF